MHDVLVVGASLSGSTTALHLARAGHSVLLVDRASFPRRKACGEGLFGPGAAELARLGLLEGLLPSASRLSSIRFQLDGESAEAPLPAGTLGLPRDRLDATLLSAAAAAGVEVATGLQVRRLFREGGSFAVETVEGPLTARAIVAADGARSLLRQQAGLDRLLAGQRYGVSAHAVLREEPPPRIEVTFGRGYETYLTPVGRSLVNVAVLFDRASAGRLKGNLAEGFRSLLAGSGALDDSVEIKDEPLVAGPFPAAARALWRDNLVLTGDAAGFRDPISGEGMSLALRGARECAAAVSEFIGSGSSAAFRTYERRQRALMRNSALLARLTLALAARPGLGRRAIANLGRRPETFARLVRVNAGELALTALRPRDLLALALGV